MLIAAERSIALGPSALEEIAKSREGNVCRLLTDLHEPDTRSDTMQVPTLENAGWHHHNPSGPVVMRTGSRVRVTGIFNYSDRGLVLELTQEEPTTGNREGSAQPRLRVRVLVEAPATDAGQQIAQATALIDKILAAPDAP